MTDETPSGLTRLAYELMQQKMPLIVLSEYTIIPAALLSMYASGARQISRRHLSILSIALDVPPADLRRPCPTSLVYVDEDEWSNHNPMPLYRKYGPIRRDGQPSLRYKQNAG